MFFSIFKNKTAEELENEALISFIDMNYKKSLNLYKKAMSKLSKNDEKTALYYFYISIIYKILNNLKKAMNNINKAIEIKSDNFIFYIERAEIKELLEDKENENDKEKAYYLLKGYLSDEDYVEVLKVFNYPPYDRCHLDDYANMYLKINSPIKAIEIINRFLIKDINNAANFDVKTDILTKMGRFDDAIKTINKAIKLEPECGHYYMMRSGLYLNIDNKNLAKINIDKALSLNLSEQDKNTSESIKNAINNSQ